MVRGPATSATPPEISDRRHVQRRVIGVAIGVALLLAALMLAWSQRDLVSQALRSIAALPPQRLAMFIAIMLGTVIANLLLSGIVFWQLTGRYGRVGFWEMQALIAGSALLNYVPLRPGLIGRVAYHRIYNDIPVRQSAAVLAQAVGLSMVSAAYLLGAIALGWLTQQQSVAPLAAVALVPALAIGMIGWPTGRRWLAAALARYADLLVSAVRYWAAFSLIGAELAAEGALAFAVVSSIATMIPILSNGLGAREWAVGLLSPALASAQVALGITADLLNRAAELAVIAPAGAAAWMWLARRRTVK